VDQAGKGFKRPAKGTLTRNETLLGLVNSGDIECAL